MRLTDKQQLLLRPGSTARHWSRLLLARRQEPNQGDSMGSLVLQIVNNVAGAGILSLSAGMAVGVGTVPAAILCLALGVLSGVTFYLIGAACEMTGELTFKGLWAATLGGETAWLVDASIALMCLSAAIIYAGILGDTSTMLLTLAGLPAKLNRRAVNIGLLTACALTPLSLLEDLSALSVTSLLGCIAVLYTAFFICVRALDGSYALPSTAAHGAQLAGGRFLSALEPQLRPAFSRASRWGLDVRSLVLTSNLGLAYIAHYNAPAFYKSLGARSTERFGKVVVMAFGVLSILYLGIMLAGHATFGDVTAANILRNYAERDTLAVLGRIATFLSILFGFPLAMLGLRDSVASLFVLPAQGGKLRTILMLSVIATVAILVPDIGLIVGISGALLGAAIVYIFPALIYGAALRHSQADGRQRKRRVPSSSTLDVDGDGRVTASEIAGAHFHHFDKDRDGRVSAAEMLVYLLVPLGCFLGVLGVIMSLIS